MEESLSSEEKKVWHYLKNIEYFSYETINTEYNLSFKLENAFLGGRLDALVKKDETYYILDYKTGSAPKNPEFDFQTMIYLLAVKEFFKTNNVPVYLETALSAIFQFERTLLPALDNLFPECPDWFVPSAWPEPYTKEEA